MQDTLNKARKRDREALAEALKKIYRTETEQEAEETLRNLRERWGTAYSKIVEWWKNKAYALLTFLHYPKPIRRYLCINNPLERLAEELKRQRKAVEYFVRKALWESSYI